MRYLKFFLSLLSLVFVTGALLNVWFFYVVTWYQAGPAAFALFSSEPLAWVPFVILVVATLLFGRIFCECFCPLGALQSLAHVMTHPRTHVRRVCTRLPETRRQRAVRWSVFALFVGAACAGLLGPAALLEPYALYGRVLLGSVPALVVFVLVMVLAVCGKGRVWCNWVCPVGTFLSLGARLAPFGNRMGRGCAQCGACLKAASLKAEDAANAAEITATRRETLKGIALLGVTEKLADGGFAPVSQPAAPARAHAVLPAGAHSWEAFSRKCIGCGLCTRVCPEKILKPSTSLTTFGQVSLDFREGYCLPTCVKCGTVCPTDAIVRLQAETKANVHVGRAVWKKDICLRTTEKVSCNACVRKCPMRAIKLVKGFPVVDAAVCVGCGACEHVCPVRPQTAIYVEGYEKHLEVRPMDENDLLDEMKRLVREGASLVAAREGVIVVQEKGSGIAPALKVLDAGTLKGAVVVDKIVGRAAAAIFVVGGIRKVYAPVMSDDAVAFLKTHGVEATCERSVPRILNRTREGVCPMERCVADLSDPVAMVAALRQKCNAH